MAARDPHRFSNELDQAGTEGLIARLESRAQDQVFTQLFDKYISQLSLPESASVLEVGCGTGAMLRFLAQRDDFSGNAIGVDQSLPFIEAARRLAENSNVQDRIAFQPGDAHKLDFQAATFDAVIANTVMSHVSDPAQVLQEMARVVRPGGTVAIFDGDYASLTYACPDHEFGQEMDAALANATFNNPRVMREIPQLLPEAGLKMSVAWGDAVAEIGSGSFFKSFAETYIPYVKEADLMPARQADDWLNNQLQSMENETFFAACTYYTYLTRRDK